MSCLKKFISAKLDQVAQEILLLLVNNLPEKHITKVQTDEILSALFVICARVTRKMHSFSTNQTRVIFYVCYYKPYLIQRMCPLFILLEFQGDGSLITVRSQYSKEASDFHSSSLNCIKRIVM